MKTTTGYFACAVLALCGAAFTPACSSAVAEGASEGKVAREESAIKSAQIKVVGSLDYGQTSDAFDYTATPEYRAVKFAGSAGDDVDVWVRSTNGGDAVAYLLDNDFKEIARNDDASKTTLDSHIKATLPKNASATHYVVFRDYYGSKASFTVALKGPSAIFACNTDADCTVVAKNCCTNLGNTAVAKGEEQAYRDSLACPAHLICPMIATMDDHGVAECNGATKACEYVLPANVRCGGNMAPPYQHSCPSGYDCLLNRIADVPGTCVQTCGGITGKGCSNLNEVCVDDPRDTCDPANGGADCGGICQPKPACVNTKLCMRTSHFDATACACVPNPVCGGTAQTHCDAQYATGCVDDPNGNCHLGGGDASCTGLCSN